MNTKLFNHIIKYTTIANVITFFIGVIIKTYSKKITDSRKKYLAEQIGNFILIIPPTFLLILIIIDKIIY